MMDDAEGDVSVVLVYIDEKSDERDNFFTDAFDTGLFDETQIVVLSPLPKLEDMVELLQDIEMDAIVTDFNLAETEEITYSGEDIVASWTKLRPGFPCFIRTAFEPEAVKETSDVNWVYNKDAGVASHSSTTLFERVVAQVVKYREKLDSWQDELEELLSIPPGERDANQDERLLEIDSMFEAALNGEGRISETAKNAILSNRSSLLNETERLVEQIKLKLVEKGE